MILLIRFYQIVFSPLTPYLGLQCRFYPSCSSYAILCLKKYSRLQALKKIAVRLCSCQPFHPGGVDLP